MKVACFSTKSYDERFLSAVAKDRAHEFQFLEARLDASTVRLAEGSEAVCVFVNDDLNAEVIAGLAGVGVRFIVLRCAGFNNVDIDAATKHRILVARVPRYSPHAVAEHTVGLILTLNRKIHKAYNRVRENNFSIDGLLGFDLNGRSFGIIGTGAIGIVLAKIMNGFGCDVLLFDPYPSDQARVWGRYTELEELLRSSDLVSLHCPLTEDTYHLINADRVEQMKPGAILVNTSRGGLIDAGAVIAGLKSGHLGGVALDVYEEESGVFFEDLSQQIMQDDVLSRLMTFPNVLVTSHQAFFTQDALETIAATTLANLDAMVSNNPTDDEKENQVNAIAT
ncbi:2-hydroxyacid dehydrogenase [Neorhodopirellula pilleata]|uniref:D-lactate dehydrogenase n=1 Tax=Neorhodopirellula pilleata TaxID=2714738 RepID=A0A5C6A3M2_9BACT|nr:2-hydroxyacid dehydrogenase [Neorhodopirellula pilleata]TWT93013.1 D-lactate dehydrogenase [Neorhodopirellula pilleata]